MNIAQRAGLLYLFALIFIGWGIAIGKYEVFPYFILKDVQDFISGDPTEDSDLVEKLKNDLNLEPARFIHDFASDPNLTYRELALAGLNARRDAPRVYVKPGQAAGYRFLVGAFDFEDAFWGAVLLDHQGRSVHSWRLSSEHVPANEEPDYLKNLYGVAVLPDGSVIFTMQEKSGGIVKVDVCSNAVWTLEGVFHHTVSITEDNKFWTFGGNQREREHILVLADVETGRVEKSIDTRDIRLANPDIHIFDLQRYKGTKDPIHGNDIEALPSALVGAFPGFEKGDLLVSFRTTNLVFVLDPDDLKVKWWRVGPWDRQHDPDWNPDGSITVFSNNERGEGDFSNIVSIDPQNFTFHTLIDGSEYNFYSAYNGMHQVMANGSTLISSGFQGRLFEVDNNGEMVFDFINSYSWDEQRVLQTTEARYLEEDYFGFKGFPTCAK